MDRHLDHKHELLLESLLTGSLPRSVRWSDAVELIGKLGKVEPHGDVDVAFVVGPQRALFKRPSTHNLKVDEIARLRRLLRDADQSGTSSDPDQPVRTVVVIDHQVARIYQNPAGRRPESEDPIKPYDLHGFHRHLIHRKEAHYKGERVPEEASFYEEVAKDLVPSQEIVLIGHGTGKSSALEFLVEYLKKRHATIYQRVVTTDVADLSALTGPEIEALARTHL